MAFPIFRCSVFKSEGVNEGNAGAQEFDLPEVQKPGGGSRVRFGLLDQDPADIPLFVGRTPNVDPGPQKRDPGDGRPLDKQSQRVVSYLKPFGEEDLSSVFSDSHIVDVETSAEIPLDGSHFDLPVNESLELGDCKCADVRAECAGLRQSECSDQQEDDDD